MATPRQVEANRQNALKSTGPTSVEGKSASRRNALMHGLAGEGVVLPDEEADAVSARRAAWRGTFRPSGVEQEWLFEQVVVNSILLDRCRRHETELRTYQAHRALTAWDEDRRLAAEELAAGLSRDPARVARRLTRTSHGCDWLLDRWRGLAGVLATGGSWTDAQRSLALDLLGTPAALRDETPPDPPAALAAREIDRLVRLQADSLDALDDAERSAAEVGLEVEPSPALKQLRRYEAACLRRFHWARGQLTREERPAPNSPVPPPLPPPPPPPPPPPEDVPPPPPLPAPVETPAPLTLRVVKSPPVAPSGNRRARRAAQKSFRPG